MADDITLSLKILKYAGVPLPDPPAFKSPKKELWWIFSFTINALYITLALTTAVQLSHSTSDLALLSSCLFPCMIMWQSIFRQTAVWWHRKSLIKVINDLYQVSKDLNRFDIYGGFKGSRRLLPVLQGFALWRILWEFLLLLGLMGLLLKRSWEGTSRTTPAHAWYPFDQEEPVTNLVLIVVQIFSMAANSITAVSTELFILTLVTVPSVFNESLKHGLKVIMRQAYCGDEQKAHENLKQWSKDHQMVIGATLRMKSLLTPILLYYYSFVLIEVMVSLLTFISETVWDPFHKVDAALAGMGHMIQFYLFCKIGDDLQETEFNLPRDAYGTNLFMSNQQFKKAYLLIHLRNSKITKLGVSGMYPLSSITFALLVKATFSVYVGILQIKNAK